MIHSLALMKKSPIHKNLNTSFVNLSGLVRHLRGLQFVGSIQIELSSYEAEIEFAEDSSIKAREQDHIAGRLSFGEDALRRIMIRSKEPGGVINVYKSSGDQASDEVYLDEAIATEARKMATGAVEPAHLNNRMDDIFTRTLMADAPMPRPAVTFNADNVENWTELVGLMS
ncbi:MAG: hypothetical protein HOP17_13930, partial [Acidobacteria bacterium]|nr:hypothetical protein [Acidobacteriota bacterium]